MLSQTLKIIISSNEHPALKYKGMKNSCRISGALLQTEERIRDGSSTNSLRPVVFQSPRESHDGATMETHLSETSFQYHSEFTLSIGGLRACDIAPTKWKCSFPSRRDCALSGRLMVDGEGLR